MAHHYSVFREGGKWYAQVITQPDERIVRLRTFTQQSEARSQLAEWKRQGNQLQPPSRGED